MGASSQDERVLTPDAERGFCVSKRGGSHLGTRNYAFACHLRAICESRHSVSGGILRVPFGCLLEVSPSFWHLPLRKRCHSTQVRIVAVYRACRPLGALYL